MTRSILLSGLSLVALASPAYAQQTPTVPGTQPAPAPAAQQSTNNGTGTAADDPYAAQDTEVGSDITVTGERERGSVAGDIKPEVVLTPADIRSYGVSSVSDLLNEIAPQTTSGRGGAPALLLNGRRISSPREIFSLPTEAIERAEVLPEEASLKFGYRPDQRVVNIVLRRRFRAWTAEASAGGATDGGKMTGSAEATKLNISRDKRFSITGHWDGGTKLLEADRDVTRSSTLGSFDTIGNVTSPTGGNIDPLLPVTVAQVPEGLNGRPAINQFAPGARVTDLAPFRSLSPATRNASANVSYAQNLGTEIGLSLNASYEATASSSDQGLASASFSVPTTNPFSPFSNTVLVNRYLAGPGPLIQRSTGSTAHVSGSLDGNFSPRFRWSVIANYDRTESNSRNATGIDASALQTRFTAGDATANPFGPIDPRALGSFLYNTGHSTSSTGGADMLINGALFELPAGNVNTSIRMGFNSSDFSSQTLRSGVASSVDLGRDTASGQVSLDLPIASKSRDVLAGIGNLTANANYAINRLSDFGTLNTYGYGLNWQPITLLRLLVSRDISEAAPSTSQLGSPQLITPNVRVFDYVQGTSVDITQISGGNRSLLANHRESTKFSVSLQPISSQASNLSITAEYVKTHTDNPTASFPAATAAIEAAFPSRFVRDGSGRLLQIDARPVNFQSEDVESFRWGINFSRRIGPAPQPRGGFFGGGRRPDGANGAPPPPPDGAPPPPPPEGGAAGASASISGGTMSFGGPGGGGPGGRGGGFNGGGFRGGFGGGGGGNGGRLQLALYHTIYFTDRIDIRPGVAPLDLLNGQAAGSAGGQPKHKVELQAGVTKGPYGFRLSGNWQSATHVDGGTAAASSDLRFAPLSTFDLRAFVNFGIGMKAVRNHPWLLGSRLALSVDNIFNTRQNVTDNTGATPINYQPDLLDPTGRTVKITFRKLFFSVPAGTRPFFNQAIRGIGR